MAGKIAADRNVLLRNHIGLWNRNFLVFLNLSVVKYIKFTSLWLTFVVWL